MTLLPGMHHCRNPSCRVDALCTALRRILSAVQGDRILCTDKCSFMASAVWQILYGEYHDLAAPICIGYRTCKGSQGSLLNKTST